ncbi:alpha/beta hydrolase [Mesorhizobium sp. AD1-1]|uniref:RBBP9/YdeN family alpha/beta hydrolase n=1 Tax=Mesorhizobium sp. AD1-1 TaxID=2876621 RepID=UPI001CCF7DBB|nr:alpha/beta hydrolase [Mesorhizobium sp. AD1-1]MBZ9719186.1 alpha/beta hydrolase [Mesorhizobium sp. AD1-1]
MADIIVLPGIGGSGDAHWQSLWQHDNPRMTRFSPENWDHPRLADWIGALDIAVAGSERPPLLVAHSLSCLLVAQWQRVSSLPVAGAFLVAVPDPSGAAFPSEASDFAPTPLEKFRFPSLIIASADDPYGTVGYVRRTAAAWGSGIVEIGAAGHINGASGLAEWPRGRDLLAAFAAGLEFPGNIASERRVFTDKPCSRCFDGD